LDWHLSRYERANPWDELVLRGKARKAFMAGNFALARELYEKCREHGLMPNQDQFNYADALVDGNQFDEALEQLGHLEEPDRLGVRFLRHLAEKMAAKGAMEQSLAAKRRAEELG
jgi:predicted Zn-dependent protease